MKLLRMLLFKLLQEQAFTYLQMLWVFEVEIFDPLLVTIDSTGRNLIEEVMRSARKVRDELIKALELP